MKIKLKRHAKTLISFMLLITLFSPCLYCEESKTTEVAWEIYRNENNISGFERRLPNRKYIETKSETTLNFHIDTVFEALNNTPSYPQWMYRCIEAKLLERKTDQSSLFYFAQSVPLGGSDRQVVLQTNTKINLKDGSITATVQSVAKENQQLPSGIATDKRLWMTHYSGEWRLSAVDGDHTEVTYTAYTEPGGFSPAFIVNKEIRKVTYDTLQGFINYLNRQYDKS